MPNRAPEPRDDARAAVSVARALTLGTAGHIDHGKTTLVKALTGRDTDRLREEKERGISIELGYAELQLPSGRRLSVVDVPGHERFVKTMVAGATGIEMFLLVVAADDGVMPQTREHLRIIELLGIPTGVVALTKIDTVDPDLAELARADIKDLLGTTRYTNAPVVAVSGVTGQGLEELVTTLDRLADQVPPRLAYPATRMPVDRVFSLKGAGTIVTGTLWSGELASGDVVTILPPTPGADLEQVRVRSVEVHDRDVTVATGGQRVALNLTGVDRDEISRGQWVVKDPVIAPTYLADVRISLLKDAAGPLPRVSRARVDHGTAEILAKVVLADSESLPPGESCYAQVRFEERALVYPGDQFILRSVTPVTTIGGGRVIDPAPRKHGTGPRGHQRSALLEEGPADAVASLLLAEAFPMDLSRRALAASPYLWRFDAQTVRAAVAGLLADGRAVEAGTVAGPGVAKAAVLSDDLAQAVASQLPTGAATSEVTHRSGRAAADEAQQLFDGPALAMLQDATFALLRLRGETNTLDPYLTLGALRRELVGGKEPPALAAILDRLIAEGEVVRTEHGYRWTGALGGLEGEQSGAARLLLEQFEAAPEEPGQTPPAETPSVAEASAAAEIPLDQAQKLVEALVRAGRLVKVGEDLFYPSGRLEGLMASLSTAIEQAGQLTLAEARDLLGTSRRFAQALLEHMDSEGLTLRVGDARRLRRRRR